MYMWGCKVEGSGVYDSGFMGLRVSGREIKLQKEQGANEEALRSRIRPGQYHRKEFRFKVMKLSARTLYYYS